MNDPNIDEEVRQKKQAENPLATYFNGQPKPAKAPAQPSAQAPGQQPATISPVAPRPATNVGASATAQQPAPTAAPLPQAPLSVPNQHNAAPTGFVNFQRYFNANKDASQRTAQQLQTEAQQKASLAQARLAAVQGDFNQKVAAGTVQAPGADPTAEQLAQAGAGYTGPGGLSEAAGYQDAVDASQAAQQNLGLLGDDAGLKALMQRNGQPGAGFSAALAGSAGRQGFDKLRASFDPAKASSDAEAAAAKAVADAKSTSATNAAGTTSAADAKKASDAVEKSWSDTLEARPDLKGLERKGGLLAGAIPGGPTEGIVGSAAQRLGISTKDFSQAVSKMNDAEYSDFVKKGTIPSWMTVKPGSTFNGLASPESLEAADDFLADVLGNKEYSVNGFKYDPKHTVAENPNAKAWNDTPIAGQYGLPGKGALGDGSGRISVHQRMKNAIVWSRNWNKKHPNDQRTPHDFGAQQQAFD